MCKKNARNKRNLLTYIIWLFALVVPASGNAAVLKVTDDIYFYTLSDFFEELHHDNRGDMASEGGKYHFGGVFISPESDWVEGRSSVETGHDNDGFWVNFSTFFDLPGSPNAIGWLDTDWSFSFEVRGDDASVYMQSFDLSGSTTATLWDLTSGKAYSDLLNPIDLRNGHKYSFWLDMDTTYPEFASHKAVNVRFLNATVVPEPTLMAVLALGLAGLRIKRRTN